MPLQRDRRERVGVKTGGGRYGHGLGFGLPSVVAIVIGGISLAGGAGSYLGAVAGSIVLTTLTSILVTFQIGESGRQMVTGAVLLILLVLYARKPRRA